MKLGAIFKEFISVVRENNTYTIGLLDQDGKVIACSRENELNQIFDIQHPKANEVFYHLNVKKIDYGYLWVSGEDENLKMIGSLLLETLTTRILYEINESSLKQKVTKDDELIKCLLNVKNFEMNEVLDLIAELGINKDLPRVSILIAGSHDFLEEEIVRLKLRSDSSEIIYSLIESNKVLIFKDLPRNIPESEMKQFLNNYIGELIEWGFIHCSFFVGSLQDKLTMYEKSFSHSLWLHKNIPYESDETIYFMDHLGSYFTKLINLGEIQSVFTFYEERAKGINIDELIDITNQLRAHDYNLTHSADALYLHKNTLIYKIKKYEEAFNIDIRGSFQGKVMLTLIAYALDENRKRKQVGEKV